MWFCTQMSFQRVQILSLSSEVYKQGVMDMGGYEKLPNTEFSIEKKAMLVETLFFQKISNFFIVV